MEQLLERSREGHKGRYGLLAAILAAGTLLAVAVTVSILATQEEARAVPSEHGAAFGSNCEFSQRRFADPIMKPHPEHAHLHEFFGSTVEMTNGTTHGDLRAGGTKCQRNLNRSAYWLPRLSWVDNGSGERTVLSPVPQADAPNGQADIYYKSSFRDEDRKRVNPFFVHHRIIARGADGAPGSAEWGCKGTDDVQLNSPPDTCRPPDGRPLLDVTVTFPQCWNPDSKPETGPYSMKQIDQGTRRCPESHPYQTPMLTVSVNYELPAEAKSRPGMVRVAAGREADGSVIWKNIEYMHADFMNGWDQEEQRRLVEKCINNTAYDDPRPPDCQNPNKTP